MRIPFQDAARVLGARRVTREDCSAALTNGLQLSDIVAAISVGGATARHDRHVRFCLALVARRGTSDAARARMGLETYRQKRDFARTAEPRGRKSKQEGHSFV